MRLRMKTIYAGPLGNCQPGETAEFTSKEGKALVAGGFAEEIAKVERRIAVPAAPMVSSSPVPETATQPAPETATPPNPDTATPPLPEKTDL